MGKKKNIDPLVNDLPEGQQVQEVEQSNVDLEPTIQAVPSLVESANIRPGYVQIRNKEKGGIVIVNAKHVGTVYTAELWEPVTNEKKS